METRNYTTRMMWKYANRGTGRIEFHDREQAAEHLRLLRAPDGVHSAPAARAPIFDAPKAVVDPEPEPAPEPVSSDDDATVFGEDHED